MPQTKRNRSYYFVCVSISNGVIIAEEIEAKTHKQAESLFLSTYKVLSFKTLGPFFKKRGVFFDKTIDIKFGNVSRKAIYEGWHVIAQYLEEPANHALLIFTKKVDGSSSPKPSDNIVVPLDKLKSKHEEK